MARLFIAVWPPAEVLDQLERLPRYPLAGSRWTTRSQWHITLRFLGQVDPARAAAALDALTASPCTVVLGPGPQRLGRSVLMVPVAGLEALAIEVERATSGLGRGPAAYPFHGHVTLARAGNGALPRLDAPISATWRAEEVAVVESHLHPAGARYETLHVKALA